MPADKWKHLFSEVYDGYHLYSAAGRRWRKAIGTSCMCVRIIRKTKYIFLKQSKLDLYPLLTWFQQFLWSHAREREPCTCGNQSLDDLGSVAGRERNDKCPISFTKKIGELNWAEVTTSTSYLNKSCSEYLIIWFSNRIVKLLEEWNLKSYRNKIFGISI
jgi:hypothetical protein